MLLTILIMISVSRINLSKRTGIKIYLKKIERINLQGSSHFHKICENNWREFSTCPGYLYLQVNGESLKFLHVFQNSREESSEFKYETSIKKKDTNEYSLFIVHHPPGSAITDLGNVMLDYIFVYHKLKFFNHNCNPCQSKYGVFKFSGYLKTFFMNVNNPNFRHLIFNVKKIKLNKVHTDQCTLGFRMYDVMQRDHENNTCHLFFGIKLDKYKKFSQSVFLSLYHNQYETNMVNDFQENIFFAENFHAQLTLYKRQVYMEIREERQMWNFNLNLQPYEAIFYKDTPKQIPEYSEISTLIYYRSMGFEGANSVRQSRTIDLKYSINREDPEKDQTKCKENPCKFGGKCIGTKTNYRCECPVNTAGYDCEIPYCNNKCQNTRCIAPNQCDPKCESGWTGTNCDEPTCEGFNECPISAKCKLKGKIRECECDSKTTTGEFCQIECPHVCEFGFCSIENGSPRCLCKQGYHGPGCLEKDVQSAKPYGASLEFFGSISALIIIWILIIILVFYIQINYFLDVNTNKYLEDDVQGAQKVVDEIQKYEKEIQEDENYEISDKPIESYLEQNKSSSSSDSVESEQAKKYVLKPKKEDIDNSLEIPPNSGHISVNTSDTIEIKDQTIEIDLQPVDEDDL